jgi:quercetin dioxygenase-like cupin family protein
MGDDALGIQFFGGDEDDGRVFVVETKAKAGMILESHVHRHAHTSVLVSGVADVTIDGVKERHTGYKLLKVPADTAHEVRAVTDVIWLCLWAGDLAPRDDAADSLRLVGGVNGE